MKVLIEIPQKAINIAMLQATMQSNDDDSFEMLDQAIEKCNKEVTEIADNSPYQEYLRYKNNPNYIDVEKNDTGGVKATHIGHNVRNTEKDEKFFGGKYTSSDLENECQNVLFRSGHSAILLDESLMDADKN